MTGVQTCALPIYLLEFLKSFYLARDVELDASMAAMGFYPKRDAKTRRTTRQIEDEAHIGKAREGMVRAVEELREMENRLSNTTKRQLCAVKDSHIRLRLDDNRAEETYEARRSMSADAVFSKNGGRKQESPRRHSLFTRTSC